MSVLRHFIFPAGRTRRLEYVACLIVAAVVCIALLLPLGFAPWAILAAIFVCWIPAVRRLHDTGHSGWWSLALVVPYLNVAAVVYLFVAPSRNLAPASEVASG